MRAAIAAQLGKSESTIKGQTKTAIKRLDAKNITEAVAQALRYKLFT